MTADTITAILTIATIDIQLENRQQFNFKVG